MIVAAFDGRCVVLQSSERLDCGQRTIRNPSDSVLYRLLGCSGGLMVDESITFQNLRIFGWRQFASVELEFHEQLTVITGANGSGKSTLLNLLSRHLGSERPYLAVPKRNPNGILSYLTGQVRSSWWSRFWDSKSPQNEIGELAYSNGVRSKTSVPDQVGASYQINYSNQQAPIYGVAIGSHRLLSGYQAVPNIPFNGLPPDQASATFAHELNHRYVGSWSGTSLMYQLKAALAAWAAIGEGNSVFQSDPRQKTAFDGFLRVLQEVLPESLGFITVAIRPPDVVLITRTGEFLIDAASGGITTIIEIAALIYAKSISAEVAGKRFVVTIDEPENHLHPSLQRSLFPNLIRAFPKVQFIAATHSPFVVSSLKNSNVYVLRYQNAEGASTTDERRVGAQSVGPQYPSASMRHNSSHNSTL
jgi:hypothetical protein